jgi:glycosyltransferase involved in cell wall biosynthesis
MAGFRVLHVFGRMQRGGAEMRTLDLMQVLHAQGSPVQFDYAVLSGMQGELDSMILSLRGRIHYLPLNFSFVRRFKEILKQERYHAVHSHVHLFSGFLLKLAHQAKVPVRICHLHTTGDYSQVRFIKKIQNRVMLHWLKRHATDVIGVSQGALDAFFSLKPNFKGDSRIRLIYDAIDRRKFELRVRREEIRRNLGVPMDATLLIHVGRVEPVKNHPRLIEVFSKLAQVEPNSFLILAGNAEPEAKEKILSLARSLNIFDRVLLLGTRSDIPELLSASDLMVFPSLWEGLPGVVLEAASTGLPVLSSDLPGSRELSGFFPNIRCLGLSESNERWLAEALQLLSLDRQCLPQSLTFLDQSPFAIEFAMNQLLPIWQRK